MCREENIEQKTGWKRKLGMIFRGLWISYSWWRKSVLFYSFWSYHNFHVRGLTFGGNCRLRRLQSKHKYSFGAFWSGTGPFLTGFLRFTRNGGFSHGNEFPSIQEAELLVGNFSSFIPLGDNEECGLLCRYCFGLAHLGKDSFFINLYQTFFFTFSYFMHSRTLWDSCCPETHSLMKERDLWITTYTVRYALMKLWRM